MRRITTGLVFTLSATCSDLRGSSPDHAIKLKTCTATANLLFVDISNYLGTTGRVFVTIIVTNLILSTLIYTVIYVQQVAMAPWSSRAVRTPEEDEVCSLARK